MRYRFLLGLVVIAVLSPSASYGQDDVKAVALAKDILDKGATLFDKRDAGAMAATYVENAKIILIKKPSDEGKVEPEIIDGRSAIEKGYADLFKDRQADHKARNTVESAWFLGTDILMIRGRFALNQNDGDIISFTQTRVRQGDQWKIVTLQLVELPK